MNIMPKRQSFPPTTFGQNKGKKPTNVYVQNVSGGARKTRRSKNMKRRTTRRRSSRK